MKSKKFLVIGLVLALSLVLTGCKNNTNDVNNDNSGDEVISSGEVTDNIGDDNGQDIDDGYQDQDFEGLSATGEVMLDIVNTAKVALRMSMIDTMTPEQSEMFIGLTEDEFNASIEDAVFYESMISPANESYCLLKLKDGVDAGNVKQSVFDKCDPRKWVCMGAERVLVVDCNGYVLLAMGNSDNCTAMADAMKAHFGAELGVSLDRMVEEESFNEGEIVPLAE